MKSRPSMRDFGLASFYGNAPEWSEQGKKQEAFVEALSEWEKQENETTKPIQNQPVNADCRA